MERNLTHEWRCKFLKEVFTQWSNEEIHVAASQEWFAQNWTNPYWENFLNKQVILGALSELQRESLYAPNTK